MAVSWERAASAVEICQIGSGLEPMLAAELEKLSVLYKKPLLLLKPVKFALGERYNGGLTGRQM